MKKDALFMMIFSYSPSPDYIPSPQEIAQMKEDWGGFFGQIAMQEKLVSTFQLGFDGKRIASDSKVTEGLVTNNNQIISGNMVVKANSIEEATEMAKKCPILSMGGSIEVRSIIPMEH